MTDPTPALKPFVRQKTVLLTTYRRDGTPVGTPVNIAVGGDHAFIRTFDTAWKLKRIRNNPEVEMPLARCVASLLARRFTLVLECSATVNQRTPAGP